jgi:hypothetical protein
MKTDLNRRKFLKTGAVLTLAPAALAAHGQAFAQAAHVDPEGAQAAALQYAHQSPKADQNCANCALYSGDPSAEWGPCAIFPGQSVSSQGWCTAWAAKG